MIKIFSPLRQKYRKYLREQEDRLEHDEIDEDDIMDWDEFQGEYIDLVEEQNRDEDLMNKYNKQI